MSLEAVPPSTAHRRRNTHAELHAIVMAEMDRERAALGGMPDNSKDAAHRDTSSAGTAFGKTRSSTPTRHQPNVFGNGVDAARNDVAPAVRHQLSMEGELKAGPSRLLDHSESTSAGISSDGAPRSRSRPDLGGDAEAPPPLRPIRRSTTGAAGLPSVNTSSDTTRRPLPSVPSVPGSNCGSIDKSELVASLRKLSRSSEDVRGLNSPPRPLPGIPVSTTAWLPEHLASSTSTSASSHAPGSRASVSSIQSHKQSDYVLDRSKSLSGILVPQTRKRDSLVSQRIKEYDASGQCCIRYGSVMSSQSYPFTARMRSRADTLSKAPLPPLPKVGQTPVRLRSTQA
jgi:hypothetical protein